VNGGYDVDVRRLAANGVQVVGRIIGATGTSLGVQANANHVLDEADKAYAGFLAAAREYISSNEIEEQLALEEPEDPIHPSALEEVDSLDLAREGINTIIWATGHRYDFGWIKIPVFDDRGQPMQQRGVTPVPGLYFLGLHWMHTFKSGLFSGVGADAEFLADHMARDQ
jgi:putative flavoprotein involved in K+ transport